MELSGVEKRREVSQSGPGGWTVDLVRCQGQAGALSSRRGARRGQAPSGLALLHFDRPRLDCSGSLHLGGGRGGLLKFHSSQAGFFIHSLFGL